MPKKQISHRPISVLILAAGLGKRMKSNRPKVLHDVCGRPMILSILKSVRQLFSEIPNAGEVVVVVGHGRELVEKTIRDAIEKDPDFQGFSVSFAFQSEPKGTGHAVRAAMDTPWGKRQIETQAGVLVLPGDSPLIPSQLLLEMAKTLPKKSAIRLLTCIQKPPTGYGRVLRSKKGSGSVLRIVEEKDASPEQRKIHEVAASIYLFDAKFLGRELPKLKTKNAQGEYYLTDLIERGTVETLFWPRSEDVRGVNDLWELSEVERIYRLRVIEQHARAGVRFLDPLSCRVDPEVVLAPGVVIHPQVEILGSCRVSSGAVIHRGCTLSNSEVGEGAEIKQGCVIDQSWVGARAKLGPYAHLRPESRIGDEAKIGNFVEIKKSKIGEGTSIAHLSYVGDAEVGRRVNIGCGFVTCNFDGRTVNGSRKHRTTIEDDCFIGSDCQTIAPVTLKRGAYVASGSTITDDVEADALAIARSRQVNKPGYAKKIRGQ